MKVGRPFSAVNILNRSYQMIMCLAVPACDLQQVGETQAGIKSIRLIDENLLIRGTSSFQFAVSLQSSGADPACFESLQICPPKKAAARGGRF